MAFAFLTAFIIGTFGILQAGLNRIMGHSTGFSIAVFTNNLVIFLVSILFLLACHYWPQIFPSYFSPKANLTLFFREAKWWYVFPGMMGFCFVMGLPILIGKIGAFKLFVILVAAQVTASILWDHFIEKISPSPLQILGAAFVLGGAVLVSFKQ